jgi:hypothetical protein
VAADVPFPAHPHPPQAAEFPLSPNRAKQLSFSLHLPKQSSVSLLESPQAVPESPQIAEQRCVHQRDAEGERGHVGAFAKPLPRGRELIALPPPSSFPRLLVRAGAFYR